MRKDYIKYSAKRLMDIFYQEYPHLDKHKADKRCVVNIINFILNEFSQNGVISYDDLDYLSDVLEEETYDDNN